jgi:hypothetical protein
MACGVGKWPVQLRGTGKDDGANLFRAERDHCVQVPLKFRRKVVHGLGPVTGDINSGLHQGLPGKWVDL